MGLNSDKTSKVFCINRKLQLLHPSFRMVPVGMTFSDL